MLYARKQLQHWKICKHIAIVRQRKTLETSSARTTKVHGVNLRRGLLFDELMLHFRSHFKLIYTIRSQVGRALLPSILDLTESNPISRLRNSEFRTLTGLRDSLRSDVHKLLEPKSASAKVNCAFSFEKVKVVK